MQPENVTSAVRRFLLLTDERLLLAEWRHVVVSGLENMAHAKVRNENAKREAAG